MTPAPPSELWHYQNPPNNAFHIGHRGAAIYKDTVYLTTPDCHLIALNAKDGKVKWDVVIADSNKGYWSTNAPLVVRNHVLVGVSGDFDNLPGQLKSIDADTGATQWIFYSTPPPGGNGTQERRRNRRPDVDHRHLRSRSQSGLRWHGESHTGAEWRRQARR